MAEHTQQHPLEQYSESEQVTYLSLVASMCYVDRDFSEPEKRQLDELLKNLNISDAGKSKIYGAIFNLRQDDKMAHLSIIQDLNNTELKYTLISDLCLFARADEDFSDEEYAYIVDIAGYLGVTPEQVSAIRTVQKNVQKIKNIPSRSLRTKNILKESAVHLAQMGVPVAAIAASGSVFGLSAAGITSGLAALGALVGGGMLAGTVFVVPAIAAGSAFGVKKLFDVVWKDRKPIEQKSEKIPAKRKNNEQTSPAQS